MAYSKQTLYKKTVKRVIRRKANGSNSRKVIRRKKRTQRN